MIKVADIERIRWAHRRDGMTIREIARSFHVSRKTVRRALEDPGPWQYRRSQPRPEPVMSAVAPVIEEWLRQDATAPRKQRHTSKRIYERLRMEYGFTGGESTVRQWVRRHGVAKVNDVTIPLVHDPGAEAQVDFGEAMVVIAGVETKVYLFCARLAYSTRDVVRAYICQDRVAWLDGHVHTFETWGGAPATCWYDNASQLGRLKDREFMACEEFTALKSAYGFRAHHCTPAQGHEKGLVESLVGYFRRRYLVPVPTVNSLQELNRYLERMTTQEEAQQRRGHATTVGERFERERPLLMPLPERRFAACVRSRARVSRQQLVVCRGRRYSVTVEQVGRWVRVLRYAERVEVWDRERKVAEHGRQDGPGEPICDYWHFVPVLVRRPGAFAQAVPVRQAHFPEEAAALLRALEERHGADRRRAHREFLRACELGIGVEPVRWRAACAAAVACGDISAAGVKAALTGEPRPRQCPTALPDALIAVVVAAGDPAQYQQLLEQPA